MSFVADLILESRALAQATDENSNTPLDLAVMDVFTRAMNRATSQERGFDSSYK